MAAFVRYLARDIQDRIVTLLNSGGIDGEGNIIPSFVTALGEVDTKRSETTPAPRVITAKWHQNQDPFIFVDNDESEIINDEELNGDYEIITEIYNFKCMAVVKSTYNEVQDFVDNYIEALIRVLHNYCDANIAWIRAVGTDKVDLYSDKNQTKKSGMVEFEVRIN